MDADEMIESYVHDVARRLPRRKRDDVAFELRMLLADELRERAGAEGRAADGVLAGELLRAFGRPADTAARYHQPFTIIEPSDTWSFLVATVAGGTVISLVSQPGPAGSGESATDPTPVFLAWLGVLVVVFAARSFIRRRRPDAFAWKPRPVRDTYAANRAGNAGLAVLLAGLLVLYCAPGPVVELVTGGRVAAATLDYSDSFTNPLRWPWLVGILATTAGLHALVAVRGRWSPLLRWADIVLLVSIATQLSWHVRYGRVFEDPAMDRLLFPIIDLVAANLWFVAMVAAYHEWNRVSPAPAVAQPSALRPGTGGAPG